jgi:hypothetical protein
MMMEEEVEWAGGGTKAPGVRSFVRSLVAVETTTLARVGKL